MERGGEGILEAECAPEGQDDLPRKPTVMVDRYPARDPGPRAVCFLQLQLRVALFSEASYEDHRRPRDAAFTRRAWQLQYERYCLCPRLAAQHPRTLSTEECCTQYVHVRLAHRNCSSLGKLCLEEYVSHTTLLDLLHTKLLHHLEQTRCTTLSMLGAHLGYPWPLGLTRHQPWRRRLPLATALVAHAFGRPVRGGCLHLCFQDVLKVHEAPSQGFDVGVTRSVLSHPSLPFPHECFSTACALADQVGGHLRVAGE